MSFATAPALPSYTAVTADDEPHRLLAEAAARATEDAAVTGAAQRLGISPGVPASQRMPLQVSKVRAALREAYRIGKAAGTKKPRRTLGPAGRF